MPGTPGSSDTGSGDDRRALEVNALDVELGPLTHHRLGHEPYPRRHIGHPIPLSRQQFGIEALRGGVRVGVHVGHLRGAERLQGVVVQLLQRGDRQVAVEQTIAAQGPEVGQAATKIRPAEAGGRASAGPSSGTTASFDMKSCHAITPPRP